MPAKLGAAATILGRIANDHYINVVQAESDLSQSTSLATRNCCSSESKTQISQGRIAAASMARDL